MPAFRRAPNQLLPTIRRVGVACLLVAAAPGCRAKVLKPSEADAFRARESKLAADLEVAQRRVAELETALAAERQAHAALAGRGTLDPDAAAATPALSRIAVSSLSSARRTGAATADLDLVIAPEDGLGRFLQLTGTLRVTATVLTPGRDDSPSLSRTVGPTELRGCYRSAFLGTHYTVSMPLDWQVPADAGASAPGPTAVAVAVEFVDAASGRSFPATGTVTLLPERRRPAAENR